MFGRNNVQTRYKMEEEEYFHMYVHDKLHDHYRKIVDYII